MAERVCVPVSLPIGLTKEIDKLVKEGEFSSRSDAIRFGVRIVVMLEKRMRGRAEDYAYEEVVEGIKRGMRHVS